MNATSSDLLTRATLPDRFEDEDHLEEVMSRPSRALIDDLAAVEGDIMVLGVGGKMGPTLARLAKRAAPDKRVVGVARFSTEGMKKKLESWGVETITCDLLDREQVQALPKLPNLIYMAGKKFGTDGDEPFTWAMNTYVPAMVGEAFPDSRIVAFSTILVYPYVNVLHQGSREADPPMARAGEYANSCVGRERIFQYFTQRNGNSGRNIRLCFSIDMRYGVIHEIANHVRNGDTIDLSTGNVNVIWQGDANAQILRALGHCTTPASPLNISGPEAMSVRALAREFASVFDCQAKLVGEEQEAVFVNANLSTELFGYPVVPLERLVQWTADWVGRDMLSWNMPCHYEVRDGVF